MVLHALGKRSLWNRLMLKLCDIHTVTLGYLHQNMCLCLLPSKLSVSFSLVLLSISDKWVTKCVFACVSCHRVAPMSSAVAKYYYKTIWRQKNSFPLVVVSQFIFLDWTVVLSISGLFWSVCWLLLFHMVHWQDVRPLEFWALDCNRDLSIQLPKVRFIMLYSIL